VDGAALAATIQPEGDLRVARRDRDARRIQEALELLQRYIQVTKTEYDMYFMGIQKVAPVHRTRELKAMIRELTDLRIQNTAQRFRLRTLRTRFNSLNMLWLRTCKQIEDGTYRKHRVMADIREKQSTGDKVEDARKLKDQIRALIRGDEPDESSAGDAGSEASSPEDKPSMTSPRAPRGGGKGRAKGAGRGGHAVGSNSLVEEYTAVRSSLGIKGKVNASALEARLRQHAQLVKERTGARDVRFRVVAEDGKPRLKAIPVK